ncbi:outer membrane lipoprotein pcp precursor [Ferrovum sp. JA12]|uniref:glycine zipper 2TM domain-containing protein n=1 Tax=Ferrovum sp. JA12 TaxID=1356299 RepID=UPI0007134B14|nr:glycine zipper 2TM domain-containing protein [Ferrovum sp. JA12]KRH78662.1 outer membrane lipoprotein pcp precursor [Ferrovum sp. JA12]
MNLFTRSLVIVAPVAFLLAGCAGPGVGGGDYTTSQVRGEQSVRLGTVESVRNVRIQSDQPGIVGVLGGGVAGAALGSTVGGGNGNAAATVLGALAGAVAGNSVENNVETKDGVEVTVRLDSGYVIAVTQGADEAFKVGERVQILGGGGATRVTRLAGNSGLNAPLTPIAAPASNTNMPPPPAPVRNTAPQQQYQYYCPDNNQYYPTVQSCKSPWMKVVK